MRTNGLVRSFVYGGVCLTTVAALAKTVTVSTPEELIAQLATLNGNAHTIQLEPGDYNLPAEGMSTNATYGLSSLEVNKVKLVGLGETPAEVKLIGNGNMRVIYATGTPTIQNLTITNGNASAKYNDLKNSNRGGGVNGNAIVTNCVITGCKAGIGGGGQNSTKYYNSIIENCSAGTGGGFHNGTAYSTIIRNNTSTSDGGGVYTASLYDCQVLNNTCTDSAKKGGGGYGVTFATNTLFAGNTSTSSGGGVAYGDSSDPDGSHLWDCVISNNVSTVGAGGGAYRVTLHGCKVIYNRALGNAGGGVSTAHVFDSLIANNCAEKGGGGGYSCSDGGQYWVSNCVIRANRCSSTAATSHGGGVYGSALIYDSEICGNYAASAYSTSAGKTYVGTGGGVAGSQAVAHGCSIHDNYSDSYGGGVRGARAINCRIANNLAGDTGLNSYYADFEGCDISGSSVSGGSAVNCDFHHIGGPITIVNPYTNATATVNFAYTTYPKATNCLFRLNGVENGALDTMFCGVGAAISPSSLVNCTVVSNKTMYMFRYFTVADYPMDVINCVFVDNLYSSGNMRRDLSTVSKYISTDALHFDHVAYGVSSITNLAEFATGPMYQFGANGFGATPGFVYKKDAAHPYALRCDSPLCGIGVKQDWMVDATDIRGEGFPRLRNNAVDIGCYQCWLNPVGTALYLR